MWSAASSCPPSSSSAARANTSKVTMVEAGLPGSPKKKRSRARPKTSGWPGWMSTRSKKNSAPQCRQRLFHYVVLARGDAAGEQQQVGAEALFDDFARVLDSVARHGSTRGMPPARATCAASERALELRI